MNGPRISALLTVVILVTTAEVLMVTANAQSPELGDNNPPVCPPDVLNSNPARQVTIGAVTLLLPEGQYFAVELSGTKDVVACHRATAGIRLSGDDCSELGRYVTEDEENVALDAIAASCTIDDTFTPAPPTPTSTRAPAAAAPPIQPPDTGSGGLR